jgi:hypothetical protein
VQHEAKASHYILEHPPIRKGEHSKGARANSGGSQDYGDTTINPAGSLTQFLDVR